MEAIKSNIKSGVNYAYDGFCDFIEQENRLTEIGLYGLSSSILVYAYIRRRPISRFVKASDIPAHFVKERIPQTGIVDKIKSTETGPVLLVNHKPPLNISLFKKTLPVKVAGVSIDANGFTWMQMLLADEKIKFVPVNNTGVECHAKVFLLEKNRRTIDIAKALVGLGFAKAIPVTDIKSLKIDESFRSYHAQLRLSEFKARSFRRGCWSQLPEPWIRYKIRSEWEKLWFRMKPAERKIPVLVR